VLELSGTALFGARMNVKLLTTKAGGIRPTKDAIQAALADFAAKAEPKDILLVYLSGHGTTWPENSADGQFYYLTPDNSSFNFEDANNRRHAISQDSLQAWIRGVKARKRILILDACNSGEVVKQLESGAKGNLNSDQRRALERMKDRGGFFRAGRQRRRQIQLRRPPFRPRSAHLQPVAQHAQGSRPRQKPLRGCGQTCSPKSATTCPNWPAN
jgi:hypothetical protein